MGHEMDLLIFFKETDLNTTLTPQLLVSTTGYQICCPSLSVAGGQ